MRWEEIKLKIITQITSFLPSFSVVAESDKDSLERLATLKEDFSSATDLLNELHFLLEIEKVIYSKINSYVRGLRVSTDTDLERIRMSPVLQAIQPYIGFLTNLNRLLIDGVDTDHFKSSLGGDIATIASKIDISTYRVMNMEEYSDILEGSWAVALGQEINFLHKMKNVIILSLLKANLMIVGRELIGLLKSGVAPKIPVKFRHHA